MSEKMIAEKAPAAANNVKAILLISGAALLVIGVSVGIYSFLKKRKQAKDGQSDPSTNSIKSEDDLVEPTELNTKTSDTSRLTAFPTRSGFVCNNKGYPLKYGTCNEEVRVLQSYLKKMYQADLGTSGAGRNGVDGKFGMATKNAAIQFLGKSIFTPKDIIGIRTALKFLPK